LPILEVNFDEDCDDLHITKGCLNLKPFENPHDHHEFAFEVLLPNQPLVPNTLHCPKETLLFGHVNLSSTPMISQFLDHVGSNPNPIAMTSHSINLVESYLPNHAFSTSQLVDSIGSNPNLLLYKGVSNEGKQDILQCHDAPILMAIPLIFLVLQ